MTRIEAPGGVLAGVRRWIKRLLVSGPRRDRRQEPERVVYALGLAQPSVEPMAYGLGKHGWVSVRLSEETHFQMLRDWIDEATVP